MSSKLAKDMPQISTEHGARAKKWKKNSKSGMTAFMSATRKSKKGSDEITGWLMEGKWFVCEMFD
jgi:hypothetical protein